MYLLRASAFCCCSKDERSRDVKPACWYTEDASIAACAGGSRASGPLLPAMHAVKPRNGFLPITKPRPAEPDRYCLLLPGTPYTSTRQSFRTVSLIQGGEPS